MEQFAFCTLHFMSCGSMLSISVPPFGSSGRSNETTGVKSMMSDPRANGLFATAETSEHIADCPEAGPIPAQGSPQRTYLARLASQCQAYGLASRMTGREIALLHVVSPMTRHAVQVVCEASENGLQYLWSRGGHASVDDPAAITQIVAGLS